jgi:hypothetical protein
MLPILLLGLWLRDDFATAWWYPAALVVVPGAVWIIVALKTDLLDKLILVEREGEPPRRYRALRVERRYSLFIVTAPAVGLLATIQALNTWGFPELSGTLLAYLVLWHVFQVLPLWLWLADRAIASSRLPPAETEVFRGVWVSGVTSEAGPEGAVVVAGVRVEGVRSVETVVNAVVGQQILPALTGGRRRWVLAVDGEPVGELIQGWQHSRWWPPIEWTASPSGLFKGERIEFRSAER